MKRTGPILIVIAILGTIYILASNLVEDESWKKVFGIITVTGVVLGFWAKVFKKDKRYKAIVVTLKKLPIAEHFIDDAINPKVNRDVYYYDTKRQLLEFSLKQSNRFYQVLPEGAGLTKIEIVIKSLINFSRNENNNVEQWKDTDKKQFTFITGKSGSGKSFELRKRHKYYCDQLNSKKVNGQFDDTHKIPVYIELKSLGQISDKSWLKNGIIKAGNIDEVSFNAEHIDEMICRNELVYFLDALDEVDELYRESCLNKIVSLSREATVFVTCRSDIYEELRYKRDNYSKNREHELVPPYNEPMEYHLLPLTEDWIELIVENLKDKDYTADEVREILKYVKSAGNEFKQHLTTPIILNLFISTYRGLTTKDLIALESGDEKQILKILWRHYERSMITLKLSGQKGKKDTKGKINDLRSYTIWIAKIMGNNSFSVESIQPNWLCKINAEGSVEPSKGPQRRYFLITRILASVIIGIGLGCIISTPFSFISNSILGGIIIAFWAGLYPIIGKKIPPRWLNLSFTFFMFVSLVIGCGIFQGFSVPRLENEVSNSVFSLAESWSGVLLGITLSSIFSYRIILEKSKNQYILPVERFHFDWGHALKKGVTMGFLGGIVVGGIALLAKNSQTGSIFFNDWLIPLIHRIAHSVYKAPLSEWELNIGIFLYAFIVMFIVASVILTVLIGPYNEKDFKTEQEKQRLNLNIRRSGLKALKNAFQIALFGLAIYSISIFKWNFESLFYGVKIAVGILLLGFFWFGGMEVINFFILKLNLYVRGISPLNYRDWVNSYQQMGILFTSGHKMKFYHSSLVDYYSNYEDAIGSFNPKNSQNSTRTMLAAILCFFIFSLFLIFPFYQRYYNNGYWKHSSEIEYLSRGLLRKDKNRYICQKSGELHINASGYIHVGTFVGRVSPYGTQYGFLGIEMDSAYNVKDLGRYRHAALLMRKKSVKTGQWSEFDYVSSGIIDGKKAFKVDKGDELEFTINDKEWQNNSSHFKLKLTIN